VKTVLEIPAGLCYHSYLNLMSCVARERNVDMAVLKLKEPNENRQIRFELEYLMSLSTPQRFRMMFEKSRRMASLLLKRNGRRKTTQITKRT